ncbi:hypothetical protein DRN73_02575 [Candidatus Pacearchaeota archaeon]|nr:MAG: hypothetical protein DRN73_02575 [Candidatus Pacearchaeota archaeon]
MKKLYSILLIIIIIILIGVVIYTHYEKPKTLNSNNKHSYVPSQPIVYEPATEEDFKKFEEILPNNEIIQKLPENAKILIKFYNFDSGEREWDYSYLLTKGKVEKSSDENVDIILIISSMYLSKFNENNFCFIIKDAKRNGDFGSQLKISKIKLLWKYKSVMSYKDCLGL